MERKSVVVTGYCVTQTPNGLLFVPFGVIVYRCNPSRVVWLAGSFSVLRHMFPALFQMSGLPLSCVCFLHFGPNLNSQRNIVVFNAQPSLSLKPAVGLSNMCDGVYIRFGSWDSRSEAFLEERKHYCLSWASRLGGRNVHLDQEDVLMAKARLNLV